MNLSVQPEELLWTVVAAVGLAFALYNGREARKDVQVVIASGVNGTRILWAKFSRLLHGTLAAIEFAFILIGVIAMLRRPSPDTTDAARILLLVLLVGASALLTLVSIMWQRVNDAISRALYRTGERHD
jgi:hypothetical protein